MSQSVERAQSTESDTSHERWPNEAGKVSARSPENARRLERLSSAIKLLHELKTALYILAQNNQAKDVYAFRVSLFPDAREVLEARAPWLLPFLERLQDRFVPNFTTLHAITIFSDLLIAERIRLEYPYRQAEPLVARMLRNQSEWAFRRFFPG